MKSKKELARRGEGGTITVDGETKGVLKPDPAAAKKKKIFGKYMKKAHKAWAEDADNPHNAIRL